ncbi:SKI family transcriptional corepressor 1 homolog-B-like [Saccostrea cucullata]|uniref:SKI family transcriptional corepressor 1 homolog-B-like n=1 Tax=Saccostrea cuccullata TaxID=36930 RepID=UPI002ED00095
MSPWEERKGTSEDSTDRKSEMDFQYQDNHSSDFVTKQSSSSSCPADNEVGSVVLFGVPIVCLYVESKERLCLAQISNTLLRNFSYNEIHNRRVALGITCLQCTPVQLEILRRTGAMPVSSRRCGLITKREAERLVRSFVEEIPPPKLPENFSFKVYHTCGWGCQGMFLPSRYNSSRAKCIKCSFCNSFFSPNKFIFHYHKTPSASYRHPDAANFNSWRRHLLLSDPSPNDSLQHAWEDVKSMFNGGCRKRTTQHSLGSSASSNSSPIPMGQFNQCSYDHLQSMPSGVNQFNRYIGSTMVETETQERPMTHSSFQSSYPSNVIGPYGDILRSLSMHYNPWWKSMYLTGRPYSPCNSVPLPINMSCINYPPMILASPNNSSRSSTEEDVQYPENPTPARVTKGEEKRRAIQTVVERSQGDTPTSVPSIGNQFIGAGKPSSTSTGIDDGNFGDKSKSLTDSKVKEEQTKTRILDENCTE